MKFKILVLLLFFSLLNFTPSFSQIAGESTYQFLNIPSSPRQLALGGKNTENY
mgnify:FL=1